MWISLRSVAGTLWSGCDPLFRLVPTVACFATLVGIFLGDLLGTGRAPFSDFFGVAADLTPLFVAVTDGLTVFFDFILLLEKNGEHVDKVSTGANWFFIQFSYDLSSVSL